IVLEGADLIVASDDEYKLKSVLDILQSKLVKRGVSLKALSYGPLEQALGGTVRQKIALQQGISSEKAKEIAKAVRDAKFKAQTQIQGDQVRVLSKNKDELQTVIAFLKSQDFGLPLQFTNYR
ncbi:MAG: nucleotide-binding protein, partial [Nitrospirae bacterium]|nr:nucleotide-binding protein [Nitrospirota bacterium]